MLEFFVEKFLLKLNIFTTFAQTHDSELKIRLFTKAVHRRVYKLFASKYVSERTSEKKRVKGREVSECVCVCERERSMRVGGGGGLV